METHGKDGVPVRVHLEKACAGFMPNADALAKLESELPLPDLTADIWLTFKELDLRRAWNENGPQRWSWVDLNAYMAVNGVRLGRWYLRTLFALEAAFFSVRAENKT